MGFKCFIKKTEQIRLRYFFVQKMIKTASIFFLACNLSGCALIGLLLKLAPLAAIFVEYSEPMQTEEGQILCVKALRYAEKSGENTCIVKSEYFISLLDNEGTELTNTPLGIGEGYFAINEFDINAAMNEQFVLELNGNNLNKQWYVDIRDISLLSCKSIE
ncbi:MAG: hypothetical protein ABH836_05870 [Candidatus Omnitrophota bacterium]